MPITHTARKKKYWIHLSLLKISEIITSRLNVKLRDQTEDVRSKVRRGVGFNLWVVLLS